MIKSESIIRSYGTLAILALAMLATRFQHFGDAYTAALVVGAVAWTTLTQVRAGHLAL